MREALIWAAVQMSSQGDVAANLERVRVLTRKACERGARVVLLPEGFAYMGDEEGKQRIAEDLEAGGPVTRELASLSESLGIWIIAGGMAERSEDPARPFNTCAVFGPSGRLMAKYRKMHLFDVDLADGSRYRESESSFPGDMPVTVPIGECRVGLSICYDLRFPELYRALSSQGAQVMVVPAAFTLLTGKDHWHVLLRARAIETQSYVVAAAQWGAHPKGRRTYGKSCVIDPWGEVIAQASEGEGIVSAELDLTYLERVRANLPALAHRRIF